MTLDFQDAISGLAITTGESLVHQLLSIAFLCNSGMFEHIHIRPCLSVSILGHVLSLAIFGQFENICICVLAVGLLSVMSLVCAQTNLSVFGGGGGGGEGV